MSPRTRQLALFALAAMVLLALAGLLLGGYRVREGPFLFSAGSVLLITFAALVAYLLRRSDLRAARARRDAGMGEDAGEGLAGGEPGAAGMAPVKPPLVVPQDDTSGPYHACMACGSPDLRSTFLSGALFPDVWRCERCGHKGPRIEFARAADYQAYLTGLGEDHEARLKDRRLRGP